MICRKESKIMTSVFQRIGYFYEFLGECYIHGIMDGEAMAYQNDTGEGKEPISACVFELR